MNLSKLTNRQLIAKFNQAVNLHTKTIEIAAKIWMEMRERTLDLSSYPSSFHRVFPLIATGKLLPEAVMQLAGENTKLLLLSPLSIPIQKAIVAGKKLQVVRGSEVEERPYTALSTDEAKRVLQGGEINSPAQQKKQLQTSEKKPLPLKPKDREKFREITWRQTFKEMWRRGSKEDQIWAKKFIKEVSNG